MDSFRLSSVLKLVCAFVSFSFSTQAFAQTAPDCRVAGAENAPITIEEFSDFECPFCAKGFHVMNEVLGLYPGKVKIVFRNLPLSMIHPQALPAARAFAAVCLMDPKIAGAYQSALFTNQDRLASEGELFLTEVARSLGLNGSKFKAKMNSIEVQTLLDRDQALANELKLQGTPGFRIGREIVRGAYPVEEFKRIIDSQLKP